MSLPVCVIEASISSVDFDSSLAARTVRDNHHCCRSLCDGICQYTIIRDPERYALAIHYNDIVLFTLCRGWAMSPDDFPSSALHF